jgi:hypothetical protein
MSYFDILQKGRLFDEKITITIIKYVDGSLYESN